MARFPLANWKEEGRYRLKKGGACRHSPCVLDWDADGVVDAKDPAFSELVVWLDVDGDGVKRPAEIVPPTRKRDHAHPGRRRPARRRLRRARRRGPSRHEHGRRLLPLSTLIRRRDRLIARTKGRSTC
jgi:hypothetical protein